MDTPIGDMPLEEYVAEMVALWYDTPPCPLVAVRARKDLVARIVVLVQAEVNAAVAIERERCARIAEGFIPSGFTGTGKLGDAFAVARDDRARSIAWGIRNQDSLAASASDNSPGGT
jgi:hypothetical protein